MTESKTDIILENTLVDSSQDNDMLANDMLDEETAPFDFLAVIYSEQDLEGVTDPIKILNAWMDMPEVNMHGPEHHVLDGAALLVALDNWFKQNPERAAQLHEWRQKQADRLNEGEEDEDYLEIPAMNLTEAIDELIERAADYPGGACGFLGVCGATISCGTAFSIFSVTTPLSDETWSQSAELTGKILGKLSESSGPRCCKRNAYLALEVTSDYLLKKYDIDLGMDHDIKCGYFDQNEDCLFADCLYF